MFYRPCRPTPTLYDTSSAILAQGCVVQVSWFVGSGESATEPSVAVKAKAKLFGRICRLKIGNEWTKAQWDSYNWEIELHNRAVELAAAAPAPTINKVEGTSSAASTSTPGVRMARVKDIADITRNDSVPILDANILSTCRQRYFAWMHRYPSPDINPTEDQLSVLNALLVELKLPCVDFAIWGRHGQRIMRTLVCAGLIFGPDGTLQRQEILGPPSIQYWKQSWAVYAVAMIMLDAATPPALDAYAAHIEELSSEYGEDNWAIVYQADSRFRSEVMAQMLVEQNDQLNLAIQAGGTTPFDPKKPWDHLYMIAPERTRYWHKEVEVPSLKVMLRPGSTSDHVDSDARVASSSREHVPSQHAEPSLPGGKGKGKKQPNPKPDNKRIATPAPNPAPKKKPKGGSAKIENGVYTTNNPGFPLCGAFNKGKCAGKGTCPKDANKRHQCNKCLDNGHAGKDCTKVPTPKKGRGKAR